MFRVGPQTGRRSPLTAADARSGVPSRTRTPALLVSVRDPIEARAAVAGGCDLLDIKEPARGPLGMADSATMTAIAEFAADCRGTNFPLSCSAALGELVEWDSHPSADSIPRNIDYVKLGSAGVGSPEGWVEAWRRVQAQFDALPQPRRRWVAVAYADWRAAKSVEPSRLLEAATRVRCDVFLIDTFEKGAGNLFTHIDAHGLSQLCDVADRAGLKFAVAGSLRSGQFCELVDVGPHIIGVRGAACAGASRTAPISTKAVRALKRELTAAFSGRPVSVVVR